ncbi:MAG: 4Fe-4S binding protein [Christensenellales bacterium]
MKFVIDEKACLACGFCELICPLGAISLSAGGNYYRIDADVCRGCGECADACIISIIHPYGEGKRIAGVHIVEEKCIGCTLCKRACVMQAVEGAVKQPHSIRQDKCIRCGECFAKCKTKAIEITYFE